MPLPKFWRRQEANVESIGGSVEDMQQQGDDKIEVTESGRAVTVHSENERDDKPAPEAQEGVQKAEATAIVWTKASLGIVFVSYVPFTRLARAPQPKF